MMNWGQWLSGLVTAMASGGYTAISSLMVLTVRPELWQVAVIAGGPMILQFFGYIKQTPPPFGSKTEVVVTKTTAVEGEPREVVMTKTTTTECEPKEEKKEGGG